MILLVVKYKEIKDAFGCFREGLQWGVYWKREI